MCPAGSRTAINTAQSVQKGPSKQGVYLSILAAVTEYHRLGAYKEQKFYFFTVLEARKSKIEVPEDSVSDEVLLSGP